MAPNRERRMTAGRKREAVLRLLRGEPLELVARELAVTAAALVRRGARLSRGLDRPARVLRRGFAKNPAAEARRIADALEPTACQFDDPGQLARLMLAALVRRAHVSETEVRVDGDLPG
jgi:hypothetical protein